MKFPLISGLAVAGVLSFGSADAATLSISSVVGTWTSVQTTAQDIAVTGLDTSMISWGTTTGSGGYSSYAFAGIAPSFPPLGGAVFDLGTLTHQNQPIAEGTSINGATLRVIIEMLIDTTPATLISQFDFTHVETPNDANPCADKGVNGEGVNRAGCADNVTAKTNLGASKVYVIDGVEYFLDVTGFQVDGRQLTEFWTVEGQENTAILQARFLAKPVTLPTPVPLPAAAWLMLLGIGGLAALRARPRKV